MLSGAHRPKPPRRFVIHEFSSGNAPSVQLPRVGEAHEALGCRQWLALSGRSSIGSWTIILCRGIRRSRPYNWMPGSLVDVLRSPSRGVCAAGLSTSQGSNVVSAQVTRRNLARSSGRIRTDAYCRREVCEDGSVGMVRSSMRCRAGNWPWDVGEQERHGQPVAQHHAPRVEGAVVRPATAPVEQPHRMSPGHLERRPAEAPPVGRDPLLSATFVGEAGRSGWLTEGKERWG
jgi:hypothetical protein